MSRGLLILGMQAGALATLPAPIAETAIATVRALAEAARAAGVPVVMVRDRRLAPGAEIDPALNPESADLVLDAVEDDAFERTDLDAEFTILGVEHLTVCGLPSETLVSATTRAAQALGFRIDLVRNGHWPVKTGAQNMQAEVNDALSGLAGVKLVSAQEADFTGD